MPARVVVVHNDPNFLASLTGLPIRAGHEVVWGNNLPKLNSDQVMLST